MKRTTTWSRILIILVGIAISQVTLAQQQTFIGEQAEKICAGSTEVHYSDISKAPSFVSFGIYSKVESVKAEQLLASVLNISDDDKLILYREENDQYGFTHQRYQQYYKNIFVEIGQYIIHTKSGFVSSFNGVWVDNINVNVTPSISERQALLKALNYSKASRYKWEMPEEETFVKGLLNDTSASYYPKAVMVIVARNFDYKKHELHFCYKFDVFADTPISRNWIYVDASSGEIIAVESRIHDSDVPATANTKYSGSRTIITDSLSSNSYRLREAGRGSGIETYDLKNTTNFATAVDFTNTTKIWNTTTNFDNAAYDVHWGLESAYDYYYNVHSRNSIDNLGMKLRGYAHFEVAGYCDAGHLPNAVFVFGDGNNIAGGYKPFTSIEIVGHEFTHGVTEYSAALHYGSESGALNESFSDIFGVCIDFYKKPTTANFLIGDEIAVTAGTILRSMSNPNAKSHPDTYGGTYWYTGFSDFGGVHTNSGVQNFWFYLLCQGGSGTNDKSNLYNVTGIGMAKAEKIAYRTLTVYLTSFSYFADARMYSIQAAQDLYGSCSPEVVATTNAWYAVGVGSAYSASITADFVVSGQYSCSAPFSVHFSNLSVNDSAAKWYFGDAATSTLVNPNHIYSTPGLYSVKLVASGKCGKDSITKNSYINVNTPTAPTVTGDSACGAKSLKLSANGSGTLSWYNSATGGSPLYSGKNFNTPILSTTTTYYVESRIAGGSGNVGPTNWLGQYGNYYSEYVSFDVLQACTLKTVKTQSYYAGQRNIELRDNAGNILQNLRVNLPVGLATITLNFPLAPGIGYRLGGDTLGFAFDNTNTAYPYTLSGVVSISGNSLSKLLYLFFYDWNVETAPCVSIRTPVTATIRPLPQTAFTIADTSICLRANKFMFTNNSSISSGTFTNLWNFGDDTTSKLINPTHSYIKTGTFKVKLLSTSGFNCKDSFVKYVYVRPHPVSLFAVADSSLCLRANGFSFSNTSTGNASNLWNFGDNTSSNLANPPVHNYSTAGTYQIKLLTSTSYNCTDSLIKNVYIRPQPVAKFSIADSSLCLKGNSFLFSNASSGYTSSLWQFGDNSTSTAANPTHSYSSSNTFEVKLKTTTAYNCTDSFSKTVYVRPQPIASFSIADTAQCLAVNSFSFSNTSTGNTSNLWNFDDKLTSNLINPPSHIYTKAGTYHVKLITLTNYNCTDSFAKYVWVWAQPIVTYDASTYDTLTIKDAPIKLTGGLPTGGIYTGTGVSNGDFNPSLSGTGDFLISYSYSDSNGCSTTAKQTIHVDVGTGIDFSQKKIDYLLYPNPVKNKLVIECRNSEIPNKEVDFVIFNLLGEKEFSVKLLADKTEINFNKQAGLYFYQIIGDKQMLFSGKFMVQ